MKERLPQNYDSSDETVQIANDQMTGTEQPGTERSARASRSQERALGNRTLEATNVSREVMEVARDLARDKETGRVDHGRILPGKDGSVTVYNSREQRDNVIAERNKRRRRR